jgi:hypothetical protein
MHAEKVGEQKHPVRAGIIRVSEKSKKLCTLKRWGVYAEKVGEKLPLALMALGFALPPVLYLYI